MRHKIAGLLVLLTLAGVLLGDELSDKQRQLEKLQNDLRAAQAKVEQTEARKKQKESELKSVQKVKTQTDKELRKNQQEAREKLNTLNTVKEELKSVEQNIGSLKGLQNSQLESMLRVKRRAVSTKVRDKDQRFLAEMASQTRKKMNDLGDVQYTLILEQNEKGREYSLANTKYQQTYTTSRKLGNQAKNLEGEKNKLTKEQKKLQDQIAKLRKDAAQLESLIASLTTRTEGEEPASYKFSARTIAWPLKGRIIRSFGEETRSYGTSVICNGIDIATPEWTNVVAADAGEVAFAGSYGGQGKLVIIDHKNGFFTVYAYNNQILTSVGSTVKKGQAIAKSGMTGSAEVPSLHFEVRKDGRAVNPLSYLE